jgi:sulfite exporter TauE/SafE
MYESMLTTLGLGFALGLRHATEADHLAAVSAIVSERRNLRDSAMVGALWGAGHTGSLLAAGVVVLGLGYIIPERVANFLELGVAIMIIFLGARLLRVHFHRHSHGDRSHVHAHFGDDPHPGLHGGLRGWRPALIGVVHGLAGSAALTLLVLTEVVQTRGAALGFAYLLIFGIGSIAGMLAMSSLIGLPFTVGSRLPAQRFALLRLATAIFSTGFGVFYAIEALDRLAFF